MSVSLTVLYARLTEGAPSLSEDELEFWINETDISHAQEFYSMEREAAKQVVQRISCMIVDKYLNEPDANVVPLRRKTKFCLLLNNFAMHKPVRNSVFHAIKNLEGIFEESMKKEGTMPFDSELGRMSEHVLVLLMRVCQYKLKASQVHEFAESNTQFAVQLLLAILLKEPPYEFELRCNCISGMLGFTQPQAFFSADQQVEVHACEGFTSKIDFSLNLMLRLQALQVVNDVLMPQLLESNMVPNIVHVAVCNMMRCTMNVFQFCSQGATQWRQHVLLSTTFLDGVVCLYVQAQTNALQSLLSIVAATSPMVPADLVSGLSLALKFGAFSTFHMGRHGRCVRPLCGFIHDLLQLSIRNVVYNPQTSGLMLNLYVNLFHFLCNIDALGGDDGVVEDASELMPELCSEMLQQSARSFLLREVAPCGVAFADAWKKKFFFLDAGALVSQDNATFQLLDSYFTEATSDSAPAAPIGNTAPVVVEKKHLEDMPSLLQKEQKKKKKKVAVEKASAAVEDQRIAVKQSTAMTSSSAATYGGHQQQQSAPNNKFLCALSGNPMKNPMESPYGHNFDKDAIQLWINQQGSVCPMTGKPLSMTDLKVNKALQSEIMAAAIKESMASYNQEDAADLYDF